ncbi:MAG: ankyrin repeat domain-containing protein [Rickettsiales bacterium]|jgi:ankyrin repeat protein|nr:ankyrin repeat domain-containing protein [Rickettsiales bacterium]
MTGNLTYEKIKEIVTNNPGITAQEFGEELKQSGTTDTKICDLFMDVIRLRGADISNDRDTFLKTVELLVKSNIKIDIGDTVSNTVLDYAVVGGQLDVIKMLLGSDKFNPEKKLHALNSAIVQGNVQEFEVFLDYLNHESILEALNTSHRNESTEIMKVLLDSMKALLDNKRLTGVEKVDALSNAFVDGGLPKVRLLLEHMTGIPEDGIRNLLEMIKESKSPFEEELRTNSEFKVDFDNSDHYKYLSNRVIIALLRSAINKKEERNTSDVAESNSSNASTGFTLSDDDIRNLCLNIDRITRQDNTVTSLEDLQKKLKRNEINLQGKREQNAVLEYAIENGNLNVIKFLLKNGVTIINTIE